MTQRANSNSQHNQEEREEEHTSCTRQNHLKDDGGKLKRIEYIYRVAFERCGGRGEGCAL